MDNTLYVALSRQMILRRQMDVVANNIANSDTAGFKVEDIISETSPERLPVQPGSGSKNIQFVLDTGLARDFAQGALMSFTATTATWHRSWRRTFRCTSERLKIPTSSR